MAEYIDSSYWAALAAADPAHLGRGGRCRHFPAEGRYQLTLWGVDYHIDLQRQEISTGNRAPLPHPYFNVFLVSYLLLDQDIRPIGEWISALTIAPEIPVAALYCQGDDDFPAEAKILYDRSLIGALALDVVYSLGVTICHRLAGL